MAAAGWLVGCSPTRLLDAVTPEGAYTAERDLAYGDHPRQRLDVYRPSGPSQAVIVFFYGGSWRTGSKADYRFVAERLTRHGMTVVVPDYRLVPDIRFPQFVADGAQAVAWTRRQFGPGMRLFVMGHSAGAHIAALLSLDPAYLAAVGGTRRDIAGLIGISGPYDFLPITSPRTAEVFAGTADLAITQPVTYAGPHAPPALLVHGADDRTVLPRNSERLAARLAEAGVPARLAVLPALGHVEIMLGLSSALDTDGRVMGELLAFLARK